MLVTGPSATTTRADAAAERAATPSAWRVGQLLDALVLSRASSHQVVLRIGNTELDAHTAMPLRPGQTLRLQVESLQPLPTLRVAQPAQASPDLKAEGLRIALPRQASLAPLLEELAYLTAHRGEARLAPGVLRTAGEVVAGLTRLPELASASTLARAIRDSGLFLEARLAELAGAPPRAGLEADLKAALLRLLASMGGPRDTPAKPVPPPPAASTRAAAAADQDAPEARLRAQVEAAIHRIQANQLHSLPEPRQPVHAWHTDLPVRVEDRVEVARLRIEHQRGAGHDGGDGGWTVQFSVTLDGLGEVRARVSLVDETVSSTMWLENRQLASLVSGHLDALREQLQACGLKVGFVGCGVHESEQDRDPPHRGSLLETSA